MCVRYFATLDITCVIHADTVLITWEMDEIPAAFSYMCCEWPRNLGRLEIAFREDEAGRSV